VQRGGDCLCASPPLLKRRTVVTLRDLFFATPARLISCGPIPRRGAGDLLTSSSGWSMRKPSWRFTLRDVSGDGPGREVFFARTQNKAICSLPLHGRLAQFGGPSFVAENALALIAEATVCNLSGYAPPCPTYSARFCGDAILFVMAALCADSFLVGAFCAGLLFDLMSRDAILLPRCFVGCDPSSRRERPRPQIRSALSRPAVLARGLMVSGC